MAPFDSPLRNGVPTACLNVQSKKIDPAKNNCGTITIGVQYVRDMWKINLKPGKILFNFCKIYDIHNH